MPIEDPIKVIDAVPSTEEQRKKLNRFREDIKRARREELDIRELKDMPPKEQARYIKTTYENIAKEKKLKRIKGGKFMCTDGKTKKTSLRFNNLLEDIVYTGHPNTYFDFFVRKENVGNWNSFNGIISFIDGHGRFWIGKDTPENKKALEKAGYIQNSDGPYSSGKDGFLNEKDRKEYEKMLEDQQ